MSSDSRIGKAKQGKGRNRGSHFLLKTFFLKNSEIEVFFAFFFDLLLSAGVARHEVFRDAARVRAREVETETRLDDNARKKLSPPLERRAREEEERE